MTDRWQTRTASIQGDSVLMVRVEQDGEPLEAGDAMTALRDDGRFRSLLTNILAAAPFLSYRFELPPLSTLTAGEPFEFVLVRDMTLEARPDPAPFAEQFLGSAQGEVVGFANLGGDAYLVVPCPGGEDTAYAHMGVFMRRGPSDQQQRLWEAVGNAMLLRLSDRPIWISTAGGGVPWLHVRLDTRPKYYTFRPYAVTRAR